MHRRIALSALVVALTGWLVPFADADTLPVGVPVMPVDNPVDAGFASPNVDYVGTIPIESPGVSAHFRTDDTGRTLMYVSGVPGVSIYDVTDPAAPLLLGHLPLPNWENEDITVSADGSIALVTEFTGIFYLHVVDVSDPTLPLLLSTVPFRAAGHIADCMNPDCSVVWGSDGEMLDLSDPRNPRWLDTEWTDLLGLPPGHNITIDEAGIAITDTTPMGVVDISDPLRPRKLGQSKVSEHSANRTAYQHNNVRPRADEYEVRPVGSTFEPGDLVFGNGETNFTRFCGGTAGPFAVWDARNVTAGRDMTVVDVFRPVTGRYADGDPAVNAMGCSGHWFTVQEDGDDYLVAAGWYEHGTRILHVDGTTGRISQRGWWQPGVGAASSAYWLPGGYIYTVDYERGIDIVRYDPSGPVPTSADFDRSWLANLGKVSALADAERQFCALAVQRARGT